MEKQQMKGEQQHKKTGTSNLEYDLFNEVASLLKGNAALERYIEDAREAGERDVETCFKTIHDQNKDHVSKLRQLIGQWVQKAA
jgi:rubrerythrin